jgi:hypothetical protein
MVVNSVVDLLGQQTAMDASAAKLEQLEGRKAPASGGRSADEAMPSGSAFLEGATVTVVGATLLQRAAAGRRSIPDDAVGRGEIPNSFGGIWAVAGCKMKRNCAIGMMVLVFSAYDGVSASMSAISNVALDDPADGARAGSPAVSNWTEPAATVVQVTAPLPAPAAPAAERALSANPLWGMPLAQFPATRERPIFTPSRRPPAPTVAPVMAPKVVAVPKPKEPERPQLSLVGTIASDKEGFGIFLDQSSKSVIRLKVGEDFQGWKLRTVQGRETTLEKDEQVVTLVLPQPGLGQVSTEVRLPSPSFPPSSSPSSSPAPPPAPPPPPPATQRMRSVAPESRPDRAGR